jgi:hypothetical protein
MDIISFASHRCQHQGGRVVQGGARSPSNLRKILSFVGGTVLRQERSSCCGVAEPAGKDEILAAYLNRVYLGDALLRHRGRGAKVFRKSASWLAEAAVIAAC